MTDTPPAGEPIADDYLERLLVEANAPDVDLGPLVAALHDPQAALDRTDDNRLHVLTDEALREAVTCHPDQQYRVLAALAARRWVAGLPEEVYGQLLVATESRRAVTEFDEVMAQYPCADARLVAMLVILGVTVDDAWWRRQESEPRLGTLVGALRRMDFEPGIAEALGLPESTSRG